MAAPAATTLAVQPRSDVGSRSMRRLRRAGLVPGVVYGGDDEAIAFQVEARVLRQALAHAGAVLDLQLGDVAGTPVVLKDTQRHPVGGQIMHVDLLRVRLDRAIQTTVALELVGADEAPGVVAGGILEQVARELTIAALPTAIPDAIEHDVSAMEMHDTLTLAAVAAPEGVVLLDDPDETVIATLSPPRLEAEPEPELEEETELVGEGEGAEGAEGAGERAVPEGEGGGE